ncbi:MAG: hypothetical protein E4G96_04815 [Chrysiogenales bacterium]|nr:MAG: hypothetical protein E4G96_04815 [Chrysiogenales bacterium]
MEKLDSRNRFIFPMVIPLLIMIFSWMVYNLAWRLDNHSLHRTLALVSGTLLFLSVAFGAAIVYPLAFFRGASTKERILASSVTPFIWMTKECARLYISFSFLECLYYYFNILNIWLICALCVEMGAAEMICRWRLGKRGERANVFTLPAAAAAGIGLFLGVLIFVMGEGETFYARYLEVYRFFFNAGVGIPVTR